MPSFASLICPHPLAGAANTAVQDVGFFCASVPQLQPPGEEEARAEEEATGATAAAVTARSGADLDPGSTSAALSLAALLSSRPIVSRQLLWERLGQLDAEAQAAREAAVGGTSTAAAVGGTSAAAREGAVGKVQAPAASATVSPLQQSLERHTYRFKSGEGGTESCECLPTPLSLPDPQFCAWSGLSTVFCRQEKFVV